jgi:cyclic-di-GMP phosphodiesterase TipF (flagellum assembly factor)
MTFAALVWREGSGPGVVAAVFMGALGFLLSVHAMIGRGIDALAFRAELSNLREAHKILADQVEATQGGLEHLEQTFETEGAERTEAIVSEVRMLEDLVARMGEGLEARLTAAAAPAQARHMADGRRDIMLQVVREALTENRVDLYLQPVVTLPQRKTVFYESFSRLRDDSGRIIMPAEYLVVAEPEGLVQAIDNLLLFRCVQIIRRLAKQDRKIGIFCNVSLASLGDENFFPQFLEFLAENRDLAGALIFELGQAAFDARGAREVRNMAKLADLGFRFSIDKVRELNLDFTDLSRADVKFVKVAADVLLSEIQEADQGRLTLRSMKDIDATDFALLTRRYGVEVIIEKVETERQVVDILELNMGHAQGNLFGEPRALREEVLAETRPPVAFLQTALRKRAANG